MMLQKKTRKRPFMFGGIVHEICEAHAEGENWKKVLKGIDLKNKPMFRKERDMYGNIIEDIKFIMIDYFDYWEDHPAALKPIKHDGRRSEHEFRIELGDGLWFTGRIDMVAKAKKMRWLTEHKTFSRMPSEDERWRSVQAAVYFRALEEMGFPPIDGVLWDYISSKAPSAPGERTPTGRLSTKKIDSVIPKIKHWAKNEEEDVDPKVLAKLLADAKTNRANRFIRLFSPVKPSVVDMIWDDFVDTAREIQENHDRKKDMNVGRHCAWCDYQPLCKAMMLGDDLDWIIARDYQREDDAHKRDEADRTED